MLFVATCTDRPDSMAKRLASRPAHLAYLASLGARVKIGDSWVERGRPRAPNSD